MEQLIKILENLRYRYVFRGTIAILAGVVKNIDKETNRPSGSPVAYGGKPAYSAGSPRTPRTQREERRKRYRIFTNDLELLYLSFVST
ncbi:hypothetical protein [Nostoc sp. CHAB 5715]|uniref:hypothetical protein n=1 Tax=Nostoc sp. CHAB 5715 TaxID=2780400 RepID=UPI001E436ABB|nr:hypothetical protein [Nostoc sp. CHAB 5715]MCC5622369.1 hypothetical protein [Nostoc sp. CHAB 5715]